MANDAFQKTKTRGTLLWVSGTVLPPIESVDVDPRASSPGHQPNLRHRDRGTLPTAAGGDAHRVPHPAGFGLPGGQYHPRSPGKGRTPGFLGRHLTGGNAGPGASGPSWQHARPLPRLDGGPPRSRDHPGPGAPLTRGPDRNKSTNPRLDSGDGTMGPKGTGHRYGSRSGRLYA